MSEIYDPNIPKNLKLTQEWFASVITMPLTSSSTLRERTRRGALIEEEAKRFIAASDTLTPHRRIELYAQQYWWRLLKVLGSNFPTLVRLFGVYDFNAKIGAPYLDQCPPHSWNINLLGDTLPSWIGANWLDEDKELLYFSALVDFAFAERFIVRALPSIKESGLPLEDIAVKPLVMQSTTRLFVLPFDLFAFRKELISKDVAHWQDNPLPELKREPLYFVLFRKENGDVAWKALPKDEWTLLDYFQTGHTLEEAIGWFEKGPFADGAGDSLTQWFGRWTANNWITIER